MVEYINDFELVINSHFGELNVRASNVLNSYLVNNSNALQKLFESNSNDLFITLPKCGRKTAMELFEFIERCKNEIDIPIDNKEELVQSAESSIERFKTIIGIKRNDLSARGQTILDAISNTIGIGREQYDSLLTYNEVINIHSCGEKTAKELEVFFQNCKKNTLETSVVPKKLTLLYECLGFNLLEYIDFNFFANSEEIELKEIFVFIDFLIKKRLDGRGKDIVESYNKSIFNREELQQKYSLSKERVRQLFRTTIKRIIGIIEELYECITNSNLMIIKEDHGDFIGTIDLQLDGLPFDLSYYAYSFFLESYDLVIQNDKKDIYRFLTKRHILNRLRLNELVATLDKVPVLRETVIKINIFEFLFDNSDLDLVQEFLVRFLAKEYDAQLVKNNILFERTSKLKDKDRIRKILNEANKPLTLDDLLNRYNLRYPTRKKSRPDTIRSLCLREKEFELFGRSKYGLSKWSSELNIAPGTIKQMIQSYLKDKPSPRHFYEIFVHVEKYRDTSVESVYRNIQSDPKKMFKNFGSGFIGLANKEYLKTSYRQVPRNWFAVCKAEFLKDNIGLFGIHELCSKLVLYFRKYEIVQFSYLLDERIKRGDLILREDGKLYLPEKTNDKLSLLFDLLMSKSIEKKEIKDLMESNKRLEALHRAMLFFEETENIEVEISEVTNVLLKVYKSGH